MATAILRSGQNRYALVVGSEKMTAICDFTDRSTCVLFGDAAACLLLEAVEPQDNPLGLGIRDFVLGNDGSLANVLFQPAGGSNQPPSHSNRGAAHAFHHDEWAEVYKHGRAPDGAGSDRGAGALRRNCGGRGLVHSHQANARILNTCATAWASLPISSTSTSSATATRPRYDSALPGRTG